MKPAFFVVTLALLIVVAENASAQGIGSLPTGPNNTDGTISLDSPTGSNLFDVTPSSFFALNIDVTTSSGADPVHSFSFTLPTESYLTVDDFQTDLPQGWTSSSTNSSFQAENVSGTDIPNGESTLGQLILEVTPDAPIGARLMLPYATNIEILNDDNVETVSVYGIISFAGPTVVAAPEPSAICLGCIAFFFFVGLGRCRAGQSN